jgi:hypothetical protein
MGFWKCFELIIFTLERLMNDFPLQTFQLFGLLVYVCVHAMLFSASY